MKRTLAEIIRESLDLLGEGMADMEFALSDLHSESNGQPTQELADEIGSEYGIAGDKIMSAYPAWVERQTNKSTSTVDPEYERKRKMGQAYERQRKWEREHKERSDAQKAADEAFRAKHSDMADSLRAQLAGMVMPDGWTGEVKDPEWTSSRAVCDFEITNDAGDIKLILHVRFGENGELAYLGGDTTFSANGKWFTFTDYSKWGDSFIIDNFEELISEIPKEEARARAAIERKTNQGY